MTNEPQFKDDFDGALQESLDNDEGVQSSGDVQADEALKQKLHGMSADDMAMYAQAFLRAGTVAESRASQITQSKARETYVQMAQTKAALATAWFQMAAYQSDHPNWPNRRKP